MDIRAEPKTNLEERPKTLKKTEEWILLHHQYQNRFFEIHSHFQTEQGCNDLKSQ